MDTKLYNLTLDDVAAKLNATPTSSGWKACCPCHPDKTPSLSMAEDEITGKYLFHCFAGCSFESIANHVGLKRIEIEPDQKCINWYDSKTNGTRTGHWQYHNASGNVVCHVLRYDCSNGKQFRPVSLIDGKWCCKGPPSPRPLYRLHQITAHDVVYVVEGEKCADAMAELGLFATTCLNGSQAPKKTDWTALKGKSVVLIPDNDSAGEQYIHFIFNIIKDIAKDVKIARLPNLAVKEDVHDFITLHGPEKAKEIIEQLTGTIEPEPVAVPSEPVKVADENQIPETPQRPDLTIDLSSFPAPIGQGVKSLCNSNPKLSAGSHLFPVFTYLGTLIGKRMYAENISQYYYPNLWSVVVCPSGKNKSGSRNAIQSALDISTLMPLKPTFPALFSELGTIVGAKEWQALNQSQKAQHKSDTLAKCRQDLNGKVFVAEECTGTLRRLAGGYDSKAPMKDLEDVLNLGDPTYPHESPVGGGYRGMYDLCVSFIGFTQDTEWSETMNQKARSVGLFGRIIPATQSLPVSNLPNVKEGFDRFAALARKSAEDIGTAKLKCDFGYVDADDDQIRRDIDALKTTPVWRHFQTYYADIYDKLEGKIIAHGIKCAMVCAFTDGKAKPNDFIEGIQTIDCRRWFKPCADMVAKAFLDYLEWENVTTTDSPQIAGVKSLLARKGVVDAEELKKKARLYGSAFNDFVRDGCEAGWLAVLPVSHPAYEATNHKQGKTSKHRSSYYYLQSDFRSLAK